MKAVNKDWDNGFQWGLCVMSVLVILLVALSGCTVTIPPAVIDAVQDAAKKADQKPPVVVTPEPQKPPVVEPGPVPVDVSGMKQVTPLVPFLGPDDAAVDAKLYADWKAGIDNGCGGLPGDVRPLGIRLNGKTFGWKDVIISGAVKIRLNGERMTITNGEYQGQLWVVQGASDHEMPPNGKPETLPDWTPLQSGVEGPRKHFAYFKTYVK